MSKIFEINALSSPHVGDLHKLLSQTIGEDATKEIAIHRMSRDLVIKRLQEGKLNEIDGDMKISKSIFYHFYTKEIKEIIIQISSDKVAVFSN
jgi:hypothetical protein